MRRYGSGSVSDGNVLGVGEQRLAIGKKIDERLEFVVRIHGLLVSKGTNDDELQV